MTKYPCSSLERFVLCWNREEKEPSVVSAWRELCQVREQLQRQALLSQADTVVTGEDSEVRTRWQEQEDVSVVLYRHWDAGRRRLVLADGSEVFLILPQGGSDREERLACRKSPWLWPAIPFE